MHRHGHEKRDAVYAYRSELDAWWKNRGSLLNEEGTEVPSLTSPTRPPDAGVRTGRSRAWLSIGAPAAFLLLLGLGAIWYYRSSSSAVITFAPRDYVLVADLENHTGDPLFDRSLWTAFTIGLQQSTHANVVSRSRMEAALHRMGKAPDVRIDENLGREICHRENVKLLAVPGLTRFGSEYGLSVRLVDPQGGETLRAYLEKARSQDEILMSLGKVTGEIRRDLGESLASVRRSDRPLPRVTTASLQALRSYAMGAHLWSQRQYEAALKSFESAIQLDPDFAMAHAALASAYLSHIYFAPAKGKEHYDRALNRGDRITERERMFIQASYHGSLNRVEEASAHYRRYLAAYPDDLPARQMFGNLLMRNDRMQEAVEQFEAVVRVTPEDAAAHLGLAGCSRLLGKAEEALDHYAEAFRLEPDWSVSGNINHEYGFGWVQNGKPAKAREVFLSALNRPNMRHRVLRSLALLNMYEGKYREAREQLREAI
ncbi:MAG: tetratricopeptide repeat protein, partial [Acidobacteria bacterium]|nr:tetratricopeptide repeat protein [Acidobacteriota bacterium]